MNPDEITPIVEKYRDHRGALISVLEEVQQKYGYLSPEALRAVAEKTRRSLVDIYSVATFYRAFSLKPRGKHLVCACVGTACHVRGAPSIVQELRRSLGIDPGGTTPDREFTFETVNCLGACALGPIVVVDSHYNSNVGIPKVEPILDKARKGVEASDILNDERIFPVSVQCPRCGRSLMDQFHPVDGHPSIRLRVSSNGQNGWVSLSQLYGSFNSSTDYQIPEGGLTHFRCPHCENELAGPVHCSECDAPMVPLGVEGGGVLQICCRRGCQEHMLDLSATVKR
jgi:NADH-quinone oxidoreductase subunit E